MLRHLIAFVLYASFSISLLAQDVARPFRIDGVIDTIPYSRYSVIYRETNAPSKHDTIVLDAFSRFSISGEIAEPIPFIMGIKNDRFTHLVGDYIAYVMWIDPGSENTFIGHQDIYRSRRNFSMKGSPTDSIAQVFYNLFQRAVDQHKEEDEMIVYDRTTRAFIADSPPSFFTLYELFKIMKKKNKEDIPFVSQQLSRFPNHLRTTPTGRALQARLDAMSALAIGQTLPSFQQSDTSGVLMDLEQFRGRYVLIDFWASWCAPCRRQHPHLLRIYQQYHERGFEIVAISLDEKKEDWLRAIHEDTLPWIQLSDLKGLNNEVAQQFYIDAIPDNFMVDPDGKIIGKNLLPDDLANKLDELLGASDRSSRHTISSQPITSVP